MIAIRGHNCGDEDFLGLVLEQGLANVMAAEGTILARDVLIASPLFPSAS